MAKKKKEKLIEESLWASVNKLKGTVESLEYKQKIIRCIISKEKEI